MGIGTSSRSASDLAEADLIGQRDLDGATWACPVKFPWDSDSDALSFSGTARQVDLLLTNIGLANGTNGWDLANAVAQSHPRITVAYTSGQGTRADFEARGIASSVCLPKPYSLDELQSAIEGAMRQAVTSPRH